MANKPVICCAEMGELVNRENFFPDKLQWGTHSVTKKFTVGHLYEKWVELDNCPWCNAQITFVGGQPA